MSDEEDYMSDKFLVKLVDVKPSLIQDRGRKRQINIETKKMESNKKQRELGGSRNALLQESLKKAIKEDNKGFQMLTKMGYKQGQSLGKQPQTSNEHKDATQRLTEPLGIIIKDDRSGLGRDAALKELHEKRRQLKQKHIMEKLGARESLSTDEFRRRTAARAEERFFECALRKCQITCKNLDNSAKVDIPELSWFWPEISSETAEEDIEDTELIEDRIHDVELDYSPAEKLEMLMNYLRTAYLFCFWCGIKYENLEDLNSNCPGLTRDDH